LIQLIGRRKGRIRYTRTQGLLGLDQGARCVIFQLDKKIGRNSIPCNEKY
jgi:hypothetical protein